MAVNLAKHKAALEKAWSEVRDPNSSSNWVIFGYEGKSFDLKVVGQGDGGLEEMVDDLNGGKILYAGLRVIDPNTDLPKTVFINWQGEGVPANVKGACANHLKDITNLFRGSHVQINARNEDDVDEKVIMDKVQKSSGAQYSIHKEAPKDHVPQGDVGSVYQRARPDQEINVKQRDKFWTEREKEEKSRKEEETKRQEEERRLESQKRAERERQEAAAREHLIQQKAKSAEESKVHVDVEEKHRNASEKQRYHDVLKQSEQDDAEFTSRAESERRKRMQEAQSLIQKRQEQEPSATLAPEPALAPKKKDAVPPPSKKAVVPPPAKKAAVSPPSRNDIESPLAKKDVSSPAASAVPPPIKTSVSPPQNSAEVPEVALAPVPHDEDLELPSAEQTDEHGQAHEEDVSRFASAPQAFRDPSPAVKEPEHNPEPEPSRLADSRSSQVVAAADGALAARALYDYQAADDTEITFDPGDVITNIEQIDDGWWRGTNPAGRNGLFPANFVEIISSHDEPVLESAFPVKAGPTKAETAPSSTALRARAVYEYSAADHTEISFDSGDIITEITKLDAEWWQGRGPNGAIGVFPASYVEVIPDGVSSTEAKLPSKATTLTARALYDYQAADESEISFDPGDMIVDVEIIDEGWWRGTGPGGRSGLFPANYVELV